MSRLRVFAENVASKPMRETRRHPEIAAELERKGIRFERWRADRPLPPDADQDFVLAAYARDVARLSREGGFATADVIRMTPDDPQREVARRKFLDEHTHAEDEVRFFVDGSGLFSLHVDGKVYEILCEAGDLIGVPDGTTHWFDMGPEPRFIAIRFFTEPDGWVGHFTGTDIARRFPRFGQ